ncbi:MAG: hypothetical protein AAF211_24850, partial [Myxococcota bacterium]
MTTLVTWLAASALASPEVAFTEGFASSNRNRAFFWDGPPGATMLVLGGRDFSPCSDRMGGTCTGLENSEVLFTTVLGPDGSATTDFFLPKGLKGRDIALRVVAIDGWTGEESPEPGAQRAFFVSRPIRLHVYPKNQDPDRDGLSTQTELQIGTDPNNADTDGGGAFDGMEYAIGTDPLRSRDDEALTLVDSDGDGIDDETEIRRGTNPLSFDTDGDGLSDSEEVFTYETDPTHPDTDRGGAPDGEEIWFGADPTDADDDGFWFFDSDGDGLSDAEEFGFGTDPFLYDTDGGGTGDGDEIQFGTDPLRPFDDAFVFFDSDGDGLFDHDEYDLGTDPYLFDTDGGGIGDGEEFFTGRNPFDPSDDHVGHVDSDGDGMPDGEEFFHGTDPFWSDTDGGGAGDGAEVIAGTNPHDPADDAQAADSDGDGVPDSIEVIQGTDPNDADTDKGGRSDGEEYWLGLNALDGSDDAPQSHDSDFDGLPDEAEIHEYGTNPFDADTDHGGTWDGDEIAAGTDPLDPSDDHGGPGDPFPHEDSDGDGIPDAHEAEFGTDPTMFDTDLGGVGDGYEVVYGLNPLDPTDDA